MLEPAGTDALIRTLKDAARRCAQRAWGSANAERRRCRQSSVCSANATRSCDKRRRRRWAHRFNYTVAALARVLQNDESHQCGVLAAWALGQRHAREGVDALTKQLEREPDARVREMIAWALGESRGRHRIAALQK